jgi:hypothetical protein
MALPNAPIWPMMVDKLVRADLSALRGFPEVKQTRKLKDLGLSPDATDGEYIVAKTANYENKRPQDIFVQFNTLAQANYAGSAAQEKNRCRMESRL